MMRPESSPVSFPRAVPGWALFLGLFGLGLWFLMAGEHRRDHNPFTGGRNHAHNWNNAPIAMLDRRPTAGDRSGSPHVGVADGRVSSDEMRAFIKLSQKVSSAGIPEDARYHRALESDRIRERVVDHLADKYRMSREWVARVVEHAVDAGQATGLDPLLILSIAAVESGLKPTATNRSGATGIMQVIPRYFEDAFDLFGGVQTSFDPAVNVLVGSLVLKRYVADTGSTEGGLRRYVGAGNMPQEGGKYFDRVMDELAELEFASGRNRQVQSRLAAVS